MIFKNPLFAGSLLLLVVNSAVADAASFDCARAETKIEKLVCSNPQISALDEQLARLFHKQLSAHENTEPLRQHQRNWLREVRDRCQNVGCLKVMYEKRITQVAAPLTFSPDECTKPETTPTIGYCLGSKLELEKQHLESLIDAVVVSRHLTESQASPLRNVQSSWQINLRCHCYDKADRNNGPGTGWSIAVGTCELRETSVRVSEIRQILTGAELSYGGKNLQTCDAIKSALEANPEYQLVSAVQGNQIADVSRLLEGPVDLRNMDILSLGNPLYYAVKNNNTEMVRLLLEHGADSNGGRDSPMFAAIENCNTEIATILIDRGASTSSASGHHPLWLAGFRGCVDVMKLLRSRGADIRASRPLLGASSGCRLNAVNYLIKEGDDIHSPDAVNLTPLMRATSAAKAHGPTNNECEEVIRALIRAGAKPEQRNKEGKSARDIAKGTPTLEAILDGK